MPDWTFPSIFRLRQKFPSHRIDDIPARIVAEFERANVRDRVRPGQTVAITAGSRGIANIVLILRTVVRFFTSGARPFIVPAMGSHGGGTAEGQKGVLRTYGITEDSVGCPIRATMDTVVVGQAPQRFDVHFDRFAYEADHVVVVNRIKPHTLFVGPIESGLMKMLLIGWENTAGPKFTTVLRGIIPLIASYGTSDGCSFAMPDSFGTGHRGRCLRCHGPFGGCPAEAFETREPELLRLAKEWMPRLPFDHAHVLLIDQLGKDLSGSGIDTNIIGRSSTTIVRLRVKSPISASSVFAG